MSPDRPTSARQEKSDLNEVMRDLSELADACTDFALQKIYAWQTQTFGTPVNADGEPQQLVEELTPAPERFENYGHTDWSQLFDWWQE